MCAYKRQSPQPVVEGGTGASTLTVNGVLIGNTASPITATIAGTTGQVLTGVTGSAPTFQSPATGGTVTSLTSGTGITLSPSTITSTGSIGLTVPVVVSSGGTGAITLTAHGVLLGEGTAAVSATSAGTAGQIIVSGGASADPAFITPSAGTGLSVTTNATTLSYALSTPVSVANGGTGDTTLPIHTILLGEGTAAIANTGTGTAGQIIVSGGASADPAWVTPTAGTGLTVTENATTLAYGLSVPVSVANGGTGDTTLTAYAVLCGGTTSTGAVQSIASVGTSGQVLTSNGAAALPTFQAAGGGGITTIDGNSGSVTGSTVTITTGASNAQGTAVFTGSSSTMTLTFTNASSNTGIGTGSLSFPASGTSNSFFGFESGEFVGTGAGNTGIGASSGSAITTGSSNTCIGFATGDAFTSGSNNTCLGATAGSSWTSSNSNNIAINNKGTSGDGNVLRIGVATGTGTQNLNSAFICGITGITGTGTAVLISAANQLCVAVSSREFKEDIKDMGYKSNSIYKLRPVTFKWKKDSAPGLKEATDNVQYGLIAEEVADILPEIVNFKDEKPFNINYTDLIPLLLNEIQKLQKDVTELYERVQYLEEENGL